MFKYLMAVMQRFARDEEGASAVEYGLIVGLIAVAIVLVLTTLGGDLTSLFGSVSNSIEGAAPSGGSSS